MGEQNLPLATVSTTTTTTIIGTHECMPVVHSSCANAHAGCCVSVCCGWWSWRWCFDACLCLRKDSERQRGTRNRPRSESTFLNLHRVQARLSRESHSPP